MNGNRTQSRFNTMKNSQNFDLLLFYIKYCDLNLSFTFDNLSHSTIVWYVDI